MMAAKCFFHCDYAVYQTFIGAMNEKVREQIGISNPFIFRHISNLKVQCMVACVRMCSY